VAVGDDGQWVCAKCYRSNEAGDSVCTGCDLPKTISRQLSSDPDGLGGAGGGGGASSISASDSGEAS